MTSNSPGPDRLIVYIDTQGPNLAGPTLAFATAVLDELHGLGFKEVELARISPGSLTIEYIALAGAALGAAGAALSLAAAALTISDKIRDGRDEVSLKAADLMDQTDALKIEFHVDVEVIVIQRIEMNITKVGRSPRFEAQMERYREQAKPRDEETTAPLGLDREKSIPPTRATAEPDHAKALLEKRARELAQAGTITLSIEEDYEAPPPLPVRFGKQVGLSGALVNKVGQFGLIDNDGNFTGLVRPIGPIPIEGRTDVFVTARHFTLEAIDSELPARQAYIATAITPWAQANDNPDVASDDK